MLRRYSILTLRQGGFIALWPITISHLGKVPIFVSLSCLVNLISRWSLSWKFEQNFRLSGRSCICHVRCCYNLMRTDFFSKHQHDILHACIPFHQRKKGLFLLLVFLLPSILTRLKPDFHSAFSAIARSFAQWTRKKELKMLTLMTDSCIFHQQEHWNNKISFLIMKI